MGSKCIKFHYHISKGIWLTVRKSIVDARPPARPRAPAHVRPPTAHKIKVIRHVFGFGIEFLENKDIGIFEHFIVIDFI